MASDIEQVTVTISQDDALVLFEFFDRFGKTESLSFAHAAEYLALMKISAQIDQYVVAPFKENYWSLLQLAHERVAEGFEGEVPGMN
jgi:hypothetical protein